MIRNYIASSLRNMARSRLYTSISIFGLSIGLCSALLVVLILHHELSYDRFIPSYPDTYLGVSVLQPDGRPPDFNLMTHSATAGVMKLKFAQIKDTTRLVNQEIQVRYEQTELKENVYWADPNVFDVLPLPVLAGDLRSALRQPNNVVLTRSIAEKYFGKEQAIGESLQFDRGQIMKVTAIVEDLPANGTMLESGIFASGLTANSKLAILDKDPNNALSGPGFQVSVLTYIRLKPNAPIEPLQQAMPGLMHIIWSHRPSGLQASIELVRLDKVHLFQGLNPGMSERLAVMTMVGIMVLFIACINFINLTTARSTRRALEVGVRKAAGATQRTLVSQFLGETLIYVLIATFIAMVLTEFLLPHVNAFLNSGATFDYWSHPQILLLIGIGALLLSVISGAYPAFILSAFRPVDVLKGKIVYSLAANRTRKLLVTLQFAIMIGLMISTGIVYKQLQYSTRDSLRLNADQVLIIKTFCHPALKTEIRKLPGVKAASCASENLYTGLAFGNFQLKDGTSAAFDVVPIEPGLLDLLGLQPVAGDFHTDKLGDINPQDSSRYVINESAAQRLGFPSPALAVGQMMPFSLNPSTPAGSNQIMGVVKDFSIKTQERFKPTIYYSEPRALDLMHVKLSGHDIPETLQSIDRLWTSTMGSKPIERYFLDDYIQNYYLAVLRRAQAMGLFSCVAVLLAALGLLGLSASTIDRRVKEIGIRKAMGARTSVIVRLLIWQFTKPVLWACLIAWPLAGFLMSRWLNGFAYHIDLDPSLFVAATAVAVAVAVSTVMVHCMIVANSKPVTALRYE